MIELTELKKQLHERKVVVTFKKVNGDMRVMTCTTNPDLIPPSAWPQGKVTLSEQAQERSIRVYDLTAQGWRSFVFANVTAVETA